MGCFVVEMRKSVMSYDLDMKIGLDWIGLVKGGGFFMVLS